MRHGSIQYIDIELDARSMQLNVFNKIALWNPCRPYIYKKENQLITLSPRCFDEYLHILDNYCTTSITKHNCHNVPKMFILPIRSLKLVLVFRTPGISFVLV